MNILIVSAHPDPKSLTIAMSDVAAQQLRAEGHDVRVSDLYADSWKWSEAGLRAVAVVSHSRWHRWPLLPI